MSLDSSLIYKGFEKRAKKERIVQEDGEVRGKAKRGPKPKDKEESEEREEASDKKRKFKPFMSFGAEK